MVKLNEPCSVWSVLIETSIPSENNKFFSPKLTLKIKLAATYFKWEKKRKMNMKKLKNTRLNGQNRNKKKKIL